MIRLALAALLLAAPALAHQPADFAPGPGFRVSLVRATPSGSFRVSLDRDSILLDGSIVGFTDEGSTVLMEVVSRDNAVRQVFRAPWVTSTCSLRDGDGGPRYEVDPAEGSLLLSCVGAQRQLWRVDGFIACPCPTLRASLASVEDGSDPGPQAYVPTQPIEIEREERWRGEERTALFNAALAMGAFLPMPADDAPDELSEAEIEAGELLTLSSSSDLRWTDTGLNHQGCDPLACDEDRWGGRCLEPLGDKVLTFRCDGAHWVELVDERESLTTGTSDASISVTSGGYLVFSTNEIAP